MTEPIQTDTCHQCGFDAPKPFQLACPDGAHRVFCDSNCLTHWLQDGQDLWELRLRQDRDVWEPKLRAEMARRHAEGAAKAEAAK
jgi:hypothetical protein